MHMNQRALSFGLVQPMGVSSKVWAVYPYTPFFLHSQTSQWNGAWIAPWMKNARLLCSTLVLASAACKSCWTGEKSNKKLSETRQLVCASFLLIYFSLCRVRKLCVSTPLTWRRRKHTHTTHFRRVLQHLHLVIFHSEILCVSLRKVTRVT